MMIRSILAFILGVFAAGAVIALVELAGHSLLGEEAGDALFVVVTIGYGLGAMTASAIATRISAALWPAIAACVLLAGLALANLFAFPHPIWFTPVAAVTLIGGYFAGRRFFSGFKGQVT
ncbi:MAG: hypothetical protein AAGL10_14395 [Pseudomonadota bacterium]